MIALLVMLFGLGGESDIATRRQFQRAIRLHRAGTEGDIVCCLQIDIARGVQLAAEERFIIEIDRAGMALARGSTGNRQAVGGRAESNILRLHIDGTGIHSRAHGGQIIYVGA
ncbi:Uncharacterised protein [Yersinia pseudotuberculosis]|nr:Uncharacterised protein [Yersinia pseudotuberculosis]